MTTERIASHGNSEQGSPTGTQTYFVPWLRTLGVAYECRVNVTTVNVRHETSAGVVRDRAQKSRGGVDLPHVKPGALRFFSGINR
jgi:hypothetical protein